MSHASSIPEQALRAAVGGPMKRSSAQVAAEAAAKAQRDKLEAEERERTARREKQLEAFYAAHRCLCGEVLQMLGQLFSCKECGRYGCCFELEGDADFRRVFECWGRA